MPLFRLLEQLNKQQNVGVSCVIELIIDFTTNDCQQTVEHLIHLVNRKCIIRQPVKIYSTKNAASYVILQLHSAGHTVQYGRPMQ